MTSERVVWVVEVGDASGIDIEHVASSEQRAREWIERTYGHERDRDYCFVSSHAVDE